MIKVGLVTTWDRACGIAEHSAMLIQSLAVEDDIEVAEPNNEWLDPHLFDNDPRTDELDIIHLNYHAALHSRWMVDNVQMLQQRGKKVVITFHDTMAGTEKQPSTSRCLSLCQAADAFIIHEPVADLPRTDNVYYWRQGIPEPEVPMKWVSERPIVGTCGFDFPWKNYELLAKTSFEAGWAVLFAGGNITHDREKALEDCNPHARFMPGFPDRRMIVAGLAGCDATAFFYLNANTGTSAAIRLGIAARRPMLATAPVCCRQFRDLEHDSTGITWLDDLSPENVTAQLGFLHPEGAGYQMHRFAEQESWHRLGGKHADLYRDLLVEIP